MKERLLRILQKQAIAYCLQQTGLPSADLDMSVMEPYRVEKVRE